MPHILEPSISPQLMRAESSRRNHTPWRPGSRSKGTEVKNTKAAAICVVVGVAISGLACAAPAQADPVANSYVMVGSDTLQDVSNALVNGTSVSGSFVKTLPSSGAASGLSLGSFDAFGSLSIQTKAGGPFFARPAGSGDGLKALSYSFSSSAQSYSVANNATLGSVVTGQVDIARSSSGPASTGSTNLLNTSGALAYVPFARDAVTYAYNGLTSALGTITTAQLKQIYLCTPGANVINSVTVQPLLPQAGSGTRKFFLSVIGVTDNTDLISCVTNAGANTAYNTVSENVGSAVIANGIIPFSAASFIAQSTGAAPARLGSAQLGTPTGTAPFTGTGSTMAANPSYYNDVNANWGRDTYMVVQFARIDSTDVLYDAALTRLLNPSVAKSLTNFSPGSATSGAVKAQFGFLAPSSTTILRANANA